MAEIKSNDNLTWNNTADDMQQRAYYIGETLCAYKKWEFIRYFDKWKNELGRTVLKTDCFEEAYGKDELLPWFIKHGIGFVGNDISDKTVLCAKARFPDKAEWVVSDVQNLPFIENSFDSIVSSSTFGYAPDLTSALQRAKAVLKKDGVICFSINNKHNLLFCAVLTKLKRLLKLPFQISHFYTVEEVKSKIVDAGLELDELVPIVHVFPGLNSLLSVVDKFKFSLLSKALLAFMKCYSLHPSFFARYTAWFYLYKVRKK